MPADPERPGDVRGLRAFGHSASADLIRVIETTPSDRSAWSWSAEQTVGFTVRRQAPWPRTACWMGVDGWVWNRPQDSALEKNGDATALAALQEVVACGVQ